MAITSSIKIALFASVSIFSNYAHSSCQFFNGSGSTIPTPIYQSVIVNDWLIPRNKVVGSTETTYAHGWNTISTGCAAGQVQTTAEISGGTLVPGYQDTYQTGIPGIGIQFRAAVPGISNTQIAPFNKTTSISFNTPKESFNAGVTLVVTGPVQSGTINGSQLPTMTWRAMQDGVRTSYVLRVEGVLTVASQTCKVKHSSINVDLPRVMSKDLQDIGSTTGDTKFSIDLDTCAIGVGINLTLTDVAKPDNASNVLSLNKSSSAQGIGYQILYNAIPIKFGPDSAIAGNQNQWSIGNATSANISIPLTARYLRTSGALVPGTAIGLASFTMSYQ